MSTEVSVDIAALVGEMEAPPCEHSQHASYPRLHDAGPATHYVRGIHPCREASDAYAACGKLVRAIRANNALYCGICGDLTTTREMFEVLGPVNK